MSRAGTTDFPLTGTIQGSVQAMVATFFTWNAGRLDTYLSMSDRDAPLLLCMVLLAIVVLLVGLGVIVDRRRMRAPLSLAGPAKARLVVLVIVQFAVFLSTKSSFVPAWLGVVLGVSAFVVLDRIAGPAWVLGRALSEGWSRRRWQRHDIVEVDGGRALLRDRSSGVALRARSDLPLELGSAYIDLEAMPSADPYRHDEVSARVRQLETLEARAARAHATTTAALGLVSGLLWLVLPACVTLGRELTRVR